MSKKLPSFAWGTFFCAVAMAAGFILGGGHHTKTIIGLDGITPEAGTESSARPDVTTTNRLRCGYIAYPPFFHKDPVSGHLSGIMVDVVTRATQMMNVRVEWVEETGWGTMIEGLKTGRFDAVCSGVWQNAGRAIHADFSVPIAYSPIYAWARPDHHERLPKEAINSDDVKIAVMDGEMGEKIADARFPSAQRVAIPQTAMFSDLFMTVVSHKADIVLAEPEAAEAFLKTNPGSIVQAGGGQPVALYPVTIMLDPAQARLKTILDTALNEMILTGEMSQILKEHGINDDDLIPALTPVLAAR